jgi:hypothetical protein
MPAYKNRPEMPGDTPVLRYIGLKGLAATVTERRLRFTRVDKYKDPFEGSVPQAEVDHVTPALIGAASRQHMMMQIKPHFPEMEPYRTEDPWTRVTRFRMAKTKAAHACSWAAGDESELRWLFYCRDDRKRGLGVAMRTTLERLERSVASYDFFVSPIRYRHYHTTGEEPFTQEIDALFHKRMGFSDEHEVRLLKFDEPHYFALAKKDAVIKPLPKFRYFEWTPRDVLDAIVVSPYADEEYEARVRGIVSAADAGLAARVELSILHPRRDAPRF